MDDWWYPHFRKPPCLDFFFSENGGSFAELREIWMIRNRTCLLCIVLTETTFSLIAATLLGLESLVSGASSCFFIVKKEI